MDGVQAPHFNYVGDSVLGNRAHLGAGAICSNLRLDQKDVVVQLPGRALVERACGSSGRSSATSAEVGCNAVLNPGALLGPTVPRHARDRLRRRARRRDDRPGPPAGHPRPPQRLTCAP